MKRLIALILLLSTPAYADSAITVHTGDVVKQPYDNGTLLDKEKADKIKDQLIDGDSCKKESQSYQKSIDLYKNNEVLYRQENDILQSRNIELNKALNDSNSTSNWTKVGYFLLGIAVTSVAVYGAKQIVR